MKVLHLIDSAGLYGAEQMLLALVEEQLSSGINPVILSCGVLGEKEKALETEAKKRSLPIVKWRMKSGVNLKGIWKIVKWAKFEKITILHSHGYKFNILLFFVPKFLIEIPMLTTVHGYVAAKKYSSMWFYQMFDKVCLQKMNTVVFVSQQTKKLLNNLSSSSVIPNGISIERYSSSNNIRFGSPDLKILAIGRLSIEKGFKYLIKSICDAKASQRNFTVDIMGAGGEEAGLRLLAEELNVTENVSFLGFVKSPSLFFKNYDLLIMPSLTEGLPITLLEAIKEKLPVLATNVGEIPVVLDNNYPMIDAKSELNDVYKKTIEFEELYKTQGIEASEKLYKRLVDEYSSEKMAQRYKQVYKRLS
jgi:glycosyltransferase involved in cell wall biosynthesis